MPDRSQRQYKAEHLALQNGWHKTIIRTTAFDLVSFVPDNLAHVSTLNVYIEGDGLAWLAKSTISTDPTPINPTGLKLALRHPQGNAVYLARPCQYTASSEAGSCNKHYWTDSRFAEQVIASTNEALNKLKAEFGARQLQLLGYSGGGAVAALVAARRDDVIKLITVAGNLDHQAWTTHHHISPLSSSLNPADYHQQLAHIEQVHFVGSYDKVIPPFLAQQFVADLPSYSQAQVVIIPRQEHGCCWERIWADLITGQTGKQ
ncbi:MAG: alpha/beta hydrolase [Gammaproteobacteria bacterium]|nr:alpha/beta hydrolase [Gammaproteobacteria bacterium]